MNSQMAREFRERWQAVAVAEATEQREVSIALRWQQTNAIFRLAMGLGFPLAEENSEEIEELLDAWARRDFEDIPTGIFLAALEEIGAHRPPQHVEMEGEIVGDRLVFIPPEGVPLVLHRPR